MATAADHVKSDRSAGPNSGHKRLWADERRAQLIEVASQILAEDGVDGVRIPDVAARAGVSRPIVYKHFSNRQDILIGILEDFGESLRARFEEVLGPNPESMDIKPALRAVIESTCDVLEDKGIGAWNLLSSTGPDPDIEKIAARVRDSILTPWVPKIGEVTGSSGNQVKSLSQMTAACARTILGMWLEGNLDRQEAVTTLMRATTALLKEFSK